MAVVADGWWQANKAAEALSITWDDGGLRPGLERQHRGLPAQRTCANDAGIGRKDGDVAAVSPKRRGAWRPSTRVPFLAHATMEPQNCTAHVVGDKVEIWVSTQSGEAALATAAKAAGVPPRNVVVHKTMVGGGFGRRGAVQDYVPHAVLIAKEMGEPVKTLWSREEDMRHDFYRPVAMARMVAGLDADGMPIAWHVRLTGPSIRGTLTPFAIRRRRHAVRRRVFSTTCPTTCRIISPTTRCVTPTCRSASGAASTNPERLLQGKLHRRAGASGAGRSLRRIGASSSASTSTRTNSSPYSMPPRNAPAGARRCRQASIAASR